MQFHHALVASALLLAGPPLGAQTCGPLTVSTTVTGPGCAPFGGSIPDLSAGLGLSFPGTCSIRVTVTRFVLFGPPDPVFLALGLANPAANLGTFGLPGCTLWSSLDTLLPVPPAGSSPTVFTITLTVPHNPALAGINVFSQALVLTSAPAGVQPALSNGLAISL